MVLKRVRGMDIEISIWIFWLRGLYNFPCKTKKRHDFESSIRTEVTLFFEVQIISKLRLQLHSFAK